MAECKRILPIADFIATLYKKYKVLDKLTLQQSTLFQEEVRSMLANQHQNVDQDLYKSIELDMGIPSFVLEILANVVTRNPIKNQFEIHRSIAAISDELEKKHIEINKKIKVLERKQEKVTQMENNILSTIKEKCAAIEQESLQKLIVKQNQIKRSFSMLTNQLKAKEKVLLEKLEEMKANAKKINEIQQKQRCLNDKMRILDRKQKDMKSKDYQAQISKLQKEIRSHKSDKQSLNSTIGDLNKKLKNLDLAYKRVKAQICKREAQEKQQEIKIDKKIQTKGETRNVQKGIPLDNLNISHIDTHQPQQSQQEESIVTFDEEIKLNLDTLPEDQLTTVIKAMQSERIQTEEDKYRILKSNKLQIYIDKCKEYKLNRQMCVAIAQLMLSMLSADSTKGQCYQRVMETLRQSKYVCFLQQIYLNHETCDDITETVTLILSRVKLHFNELSLEKPFVKAIQIRMKAGNQPSTSSFIVNNIKSILN